MNMNLGKLQEMVRIREAWHAAVQVVAESDTTKRPNNNTPMKPAAVKILNIPTAEKDFLKPFVISFSPANLENSAVATGLENVSFHSNPKEGNAKECSNYCTISLISHAGKVMLKILKVRLQQYVNCEIPDVQAGFRKGRGTRDRIVNIPWIREKGIEFQ